MIEERKTLLVLNPAAGKGRGKKLAGGVLEQLKKSMKHVDFTVSTTPKQILGPMVVMVLMVQGRG